MSDNSSDAKTFVVPAEALPKQRPIPHIPDHALLRQIGSGAYGEVWLAKNVMGTFRAVKMVYRDSFESERPYEREFAGIKKFEPISRSHEGFVDILHIGRNDSAGYFFYVMELGDDQSGIASSGAEEKNKSSKNETVPASQAEKSLPVVPDTYEARTLWSDLKKHGRLPFEECLKIGLNLTAALAHLHNNGLIHRDIKPSNIIFVHGLPKLADIGLVAEASEARTFVGTEGYIPPEGPGTVHADIFSLGKVFYEMATGKDRNEFPELPTQVDEPKSRAGLAELNEVIVKACDADMRRRYATAEEFHSDLELLQSGKSVRRRHRFHRQMKWVKRTLAVLLVPVSIVIIQHCYYRLSLERWKKELKANGEKLSGEGSKLPFNRQAYDQTKALADLGTQMVIPSNAPLLNDEMMKVNTNGVARVLWKDNQTFTSEQWKVLQETVAAQASELRKLRNSLATPPPPIGAKPVELPTPQILVPLRHTFHYLLASAMFCDLRAKNLDGAVSNYVWLVSLTKINERQPDILSAIIRAGLLSRAAHATWEVLQADGLTDQHLQQMQTAWPGNSVLAQFADGLETDLRSTIELCRESRKLSNTFDPTFRPLTLTQNRGTFSNKTTGVKIAIISSGSSSEKETTSWYESDGFVNTVAPIYGHMTFPYFQLVTSYRLESDSLHMIHPVIARLRQLTAIEEQRSQQEGTTWIQSLREMEKALTILQLRHDEAEKSIGMFSFNYSFYIPYLNNRTFPFMLKAMTEREMALTAIALKRFELRHGHHPETLTELVPEFLPKLPFDYMTGKPLRYRLSSHAKPVLYSVGEDGDSDDGNPSPINPDKRYEDIWSGRDAVWPTALENN